MKNKNKHIITFVLSVILIVMAAACSSSPASQTVRTGNNIIEISVVDQNNDPVQGVTISMVRVEPLDEIKGVTSERGTIEFSSVPDGKYLVNATKVPEGYIITSGWKSTLVLDTSSLEKQDNTIMILIDDGIIGSELFGNCSIDADESGYSYGYRSVPCYCQYNDHLFSLQEIGYCTDKIGKSYELFVVLVLDISDIPDEELTWFIEDTYDCLGTGVYLTNDDNDYDFASLLPLGKLHYSGSKHLCYLYMTSLREESRYPFDNCKVAIFIKAKQKDKYEYKSPTDGTVSKLHKTNEISFSDNITKEDMIPLDDADKSLRDYIVKRVNSYGDYYAGLANNN